MVTNSLVCFEADDLIYGLKKIARKTVRFELNILEKYRGLLDVTNKIVLGKLRIEAADSLEKDDFIAIRPETYVCKHRKQQECEKLEEITKLALKN